MSDGASTPQDLWEQLQGAPLEQPLWDAEFLPRRMGSGTTPGKPTLQSATLRGGLGTLRH